MPFNPKVYTLTAAETYEKKLARDEYIAANKHLAMPFPVEGLRGIIPDQYPGELAIVLARSHHGKSTFLKFATHEAQKSIEGKPNALVAYISHEDTSEMTANQQVRRYGGNAMNYVDDQFVYIGRSFGMRASEIADLHMTNVIACLEYARSLDYARKPENGKFATPMNYGFISLDYLQVMPPDPERRLVVRDEQRRFQIADDVKRLCNAAVTFSCPIWAASQALTKTQRQNYSDKMKIPGAADTEEAKEIYNYPDIIYSLWQPKHDHPEGALIEEGNWCFKAISNLCFLRVVKRRYAEDMGYYDIVGRVFPMLIERDGTFTYTKELHQSFLVNPKAI